MGAGNLVLLVVVWLGGAGPAYPTSILDSAGNDYSLAIGDGSFITYIYYCLSGAAHAGTNTVTLNYSGDTAINLWLVEVTGAASWTLGPTAFAPITTPTSFTLAVGPVDVTSPPAFLASAVQTASASGGSQATPGSFTNLIGSPVTGDHDAALYDIATTTGNVTSNSTNSVSSGYSGVLAAFYGASSAPSNSFFFGSD
jgi:hypothetical protein